MSSSRTSCSPSVVGFLTFVFFFKSNFDTSQTNNSYSVIRQRSRTDRPANQTVKVLLYFGESDYLTNRMNSIQTYDRSNNYYIINDSFSDFNVVLDCCLIFTSTHVCGVCNRFGLRL